MRLFLGLGWLSSSIREESVDSSSGGVLLDGVLSDKLTVSSATVLGLVKGCLGGGLGSSKGTMSVLRERTI